MVKHLGKTPFHPTLPDSASLQTHLPLPYITSAYTWSLQQSHEHAKAGGDGELQSLYDPAAPPSFSYFSAPEWVLHGLQGISALPQSTSNFSSHPGVTSAVLHFLLPTPLFPHNF